jgi:hypothetical protein
MRSLQFFLSEKGRELQMTRTALETEKLKAIRASVAKERCQKEYDSENRKAFRDPDRACQFEMWSGKAAVRNPRGANSSLFWHLATPNKRSDKGLDLFALSKNEQVILSNEQYKEHQNLPAEHIWAAKILPTEEMAWQQVMRPREISLETFRKIQWERHWKAYRIHSKSMFPRVDGRIAPTKKSKSTNRNHAFAHHNVATLADDGKVTVKGTSAFVPDVGMGETSQNEFGARDEKMADFLIYPMRSERVDDGSDNFLSKDLIFFQCHDYGAVP